MFAVTVSWPNQAAEPHVPMFGPMHDAVDGGQPLGRQRRPEAGVQRARDGIEHQQRRLQRWVAPLDRLQDLDAGFAQWRPSGDQIVHPLVGCHELLDTLGLLLGEAQRERSRHRGRRIRERSEISLAEGTGVETGDADLAQRVTVDRNRRLGVRGRGGR